MFLRKEILFYFVMLLSIKSYSAPGDIIVSDFKVVFSRAGTPATHLNQIIYTFTLSEYDNPQIVVRQERIKLWEGYTDPSDTHLECNQMKREIIRQLLEAYENRTKITYINDFDASNEGICPTGSPEIHFAIK